jgi:hypothetical protein
MTELIFFNRGLNQSIKIIAPESHYLLNIYTEIKQKFGLGAETQIQIFATNRLGKQTIYDPMTKLEGMGKMIEKRELRHFEVFWKSPKQHGKQVVDNSPSKHGKVLFGYKRQVLVGGGATIVGDLGQNCFIEIPDGALAEDTEISIKMVGVDSLGGIGQNVTRAVLSDPKKANDQANRY